MQQYVCASIPIPVLERRAPAATCCRGVRASARSPADVVQLSVQSTVGRCPLQKTENTRHAVHMCCLKDSHPRWPAITRYSFQGACHTGRGHLLGMRRATAAEGRYSSLPPPALGTTAPPPACSTIACAFCRAAAAALHDINGRVDAVGAKDACRLSSRPTSSAGLALTVPPQHDALGRSPQLSAAGNLHAL